MSLPFESAPAPAGEKAPPDTQLRLLGASGLESARITEAETKPTSVYDRFERDGYVRLAPHLEAISADTTRTNPITYLADTQQFAGAYTEKTAHVRSTKPEYEVARELTDFLSDASEQAASERDRQQAADIRDHITFIGKKEYDEAARGIAAYWKERLARDPALSLALFTGVEQKGIIKSDTYLLDTVLGNLTDEELKEAAGRIKLNPSSIATDPDHTRIILLDDWVIDGVQLGMELETILRRFREYRDNIEVQLIVATEDRLEEGLGTVFPGMGGIIGEAPVRAYFKTDFDAENQPITGFHSSSDHDFDEPIALIARNMGVPMPAGTNIVRPYRMEGARLDNIARLEALQ